MQKKELLETPQEHQDQELVDHHVVAIRHVIHRVDRLMERFGRQVHAG